MARDEYAQALLADPEFEPLPEECSLACAGC
jgi:hypothetical protein